MGFSRVPGTTDLGDTFVPEEEVICCGIGRARAHRELLGQSFGMWKEPHLPSGRLPCLLRPPRHPGPWVSWSCPNVRLLYSSSPSLAVLGPPQPLCSRWCGVLAAQALSRGRRKPEAAHASVLCPSVPRATPLLLCKGLVLWGIWAFLPPPRYVNQHVSCRAFFLYFSRSILVGKA